MKKSLCWNQTVRERHDSVRETYAFSPRRARKWRVLITWILYFDGETRDSNSCQNVRILTQLKLSCIPCMLCNYCRFGRTKQKTREMFQSYVFVYAEQSRWSSWPMAIPNFPLKWDMRRERNRKLMNMKFWKRTNAEDEREGTKHYCEMYLLSSALTFTERYCVCVSLRRLPPPMHCRMPWPHTNNY